MSASSPNAGGPPNHIDRLIINGLQRDFPIEARPYEALARRLNQAHGLELSGREVWLRVAELKRNGYIRRLGAVFNARALGYQSTLCAARAPEDKLELFASLVSAATQVTHNYLRSGADLNVWFTFTAGSESELAAFLEKLKAESGVTEIYVLPAKKLFKIKVDFKLPPLG